MRLYNFFDWGWGGLNDCILVFFRCLSLDQANSPKSKVTKLGECKPNRLQRRAECGFGEHAFKTQTQCVFQLWPSPSNGDENSVSSFQPIIYVPKQTHRLFTELTEFAAELAEFSVSKLGDQYDWTTAGPYDRHDRTLRARSSRPLVDAYSNRSGSKWGLSTSRSDVGSLLLYGGTFAQSYSVLRSIRSGKN